MCEAVEKILLKYINNPQTLIDAGKEAGLEITIKSSPINVAPGIYGSPEEKTELYKITVKTDQVKQSYNVIMSQNQPVSIKEVE